MVSLIAAHAARETLAAVAVVDSQAAYHYSNGLTVSKDGKNLLVAEGLAGRSIGTERIVQRGDQRPQFRWIRLE